MASSRSGGLRVEANEQGTPLRIGIEPGELRRGADALAADILRLCREASRSAGLARRAELEREGVGARVLAYMGLPDPDGADPGAGAEAPVVDTWLRG